MQFLVAKKRNILLTTFSYLAASEARGEASNALLEPMEFLSNSSTKQRLRKKQYHRLRHYNHLLELDFLSLSPLHQCVTDPFVQFWDPLAGNCYNISCGYHFENRNGGCFYRNITRPQNRLCSHKSAITTSSSGEKLIQLKWWEVR